MEGQQRALLFSGRANYCFDPCANNLTSRAGCQLKFVSVLVRMLPRAGVQGNEASGRNWLVLALHEAQRGGVGRGHGVFDVQGDLGLALANVAVRDEAHGLFAQGAVAVEPALDAGGGGFRRSLCMRQEVALRR